MTRYSTLRVNFKLKEIRCHAQHDPILGSPVGMDLDSEPFLLTFFFLIDGSTVNLNAAFKLEGKAKTHAAPTAHGNLKDDSVKGGDVVPVPAAVGEWSTLFMPITLPDPCDVLLPGGVPGAVGLVCALMEQGYESSEGMAAAHEAFNSALTAILNNDVIPSISLENASGEVSDEQKKKFAATVRDRMRDALLSEQAKKPLRNELTALEKPELLGFEVYVFTHADWIADPKPPATKQIQGRWNPSTFADAPAGNDWELNGVVTAGSACSAKTVAMSHSTTDPAVTDDHMASLRRFRDAELLRYPALRGLLAVAGAQTPQLATLLESDPALAVRAQRALAAVADATADPDRRIDHEHFETARLVLDGLKQRTGARNRRQLKLLEAGLVAAEGSGTLNRALKMNLRRGGGR